jgi:hypothetical protein
MDLIASTAANLQAWGILSELLAQQAAGSCLGYFPKGY